MTRSFNAFRTMLLAALALPFSAAGGAGAFADDNAPLRMHHAPHAPLPSTLPAPHFVGSPGSRLQRTYSGTPVDVTTYHYDQARTGWNQAETDLTPATVQSSRFGLIATLDVDGNVLAQPLLVSNFSLPDGTTRNILIVATGNDTVYAYDTSDYSLIWKRNLGKAQTSADVGCYDVRPGYGISGTPVIVRTAANAARIFLVAATEPSPYKFLSQLHALNLATGKDAISPVTIEPSATLSDGSTVSFDPQNQWNRPGLVYANNSIYVAIGSHCDNNSAGVTGWLLRYYEPNLSLLRAFSTIYTAGNGNTELASIWMTGFAPAVAPDGDLFVVTGNGDYAGSHKDWGESVLRLPNNLSKVQSSFTPAQYANFNNGDTDFGSGGVMLLPVVAGQTAPPMAVAMGKASVLYLLSQNNLGGLKAGDSGALQSQYGGGGGLWGGPAYYDGPSGPTVLTQTGGDVLRAWAVASGSTPSLTNTVSGTSYAGYGGSLPVVSSNGAKAKTGVVWLIDRANEPFSIEAYDAVALGNPIFSATIGTWSNAGNGNPFLTPMEANGRVYAPGYKVVQVYGLTP
jgi:hypothetical protein